MREFLKFGGTVVFALAVFGVYRDLGNQTAATDRVQSRKPVVAYSGEQVQQQYASLPDKLTQQDRIDLIQEIADNTQQGLLNFIREDVNNSGLKVDFAMFYKALLKARSVNERNAAELYVPHLDARELYRLAEIGEAEAVSYLISFEERELDGLLKPWVESVSEYQSLVFAYYNETAPEDEQIELLGE